MNSDPHPPSGPSQPQLHLGRSQLNAATVDDSENNQKSRPSSGDTATSSVPGYSHSREKAEKNGKYERNFHAKLAYVKHWEIIVCVCFLISFSRDTVKSKINFSNFF